MTTTADYTGKILMGILLIIAGIWNGGTAWRDGYFYYIMGGIDRNERPVLFWLLIAVNIGVFLGGVDFLVSGIMHVHTLIE